MLRKNIVGLAILFPLAGVAAAAQEYHFEIDPTTSGGSAQLHVAATTSGSLIGNYDASSNPGGTRTKPGLLQAPGASENVAVPVHSFNPDVQGNVPFAPTGGFNLSVDVDAGTVLLTGFSADLLGATPANLPVTAAISFDTFRTANPSFTYLGIPLNLPLGNAVVSGLSATQTEDAAIGTLTPASGSHFTFTITPTVILHASVDFQGNPLDIASDPTPFLLTGDISFEGDAAFITESAPIDISSSLSPAQALDPLPYDLPGASTPAHVIFNLTLDTEQTSVQGTQSLDAIGVAVPEPGCCALLAGAIPLVLRRKKRRV